MDGNLQYLFTAYLAIWVIIAAYLLRLGRRQESLRRDLEQLRRRLSEQAPAGDS